MNSRKSTQKCSWTNCFSERGKCYRLDCREGLLPTTCKQGCCIKIESLEFEFESELIHVLESLELSSQSRLELYRLAKVIVIRHRRIRLP
jgi:hypothetical protein